MLKITNITEVKEANRKISQETLKKIFKHSDMLEDYTNKVGLQDIIVYLIDRFEEEVLNDVFNDINDYIDMFLERLEEIYPWDY